MIQSMEFSQTYNSQPFKSETSPTRRFAKAPGVESANQSMVGKSTTLFENIKLEEKIKELQLNLASLP